MRSTIRSSSTSVSFPTSRSIVSSVQFGSNTPRESVVTFTLVGDEDGANVYVNPTEDTTPEIAVQVPPGFTATQITINRDAGQGGPFNVPRTRTVSSGGIDYAIFEVGTELELGTISVTITGTDADTNAISVDSFLTIGTEPAEGIYDNNYEAIYG